MPPHPVLQMLYRTPLGLALRMVGENPQAAEGRGIPVASVRTGAIVAGSALTGVAGAFLTLSAFNAFFFNMAYLLSILALVLVARRAAYPQALMKPYRKGER